MKCPNVGVVMLFLIVNQLLEAHFVESSYAARIVVTVVAEYYRRRLRADA